MKYLKKYRLFESVNEEEIHDICKKYGIENYTINRDGSIDVDGDVDLYDKGLTKLPLTFNRVSGDFYCYDNQLTSLRGAPLSVGGYFYCNDNQLTSLRGAPKEVGTEKPGDFNCSYNQLTNLEGAPMGIRGSNTRSVGGYFYCKYNKLTSLKGLEFKSFKFIILEGNSIYTIVKEWINNDNHEELIEYFLDMDIIQEGEDKPKLIMMRLEAFYDDMNLEMDIDFEEVKKHYKIIE
jgi:hypothetical protein